MGCDGGSIPKRDELVKQKQRQAKVDPNMLNRVHWFSCALSKKPLSIPIVSCGLGKLYNRDAILEFLLDRNAYGDGDQICKHVKSLKDVVTLQLEPNPSFSENSAPSLTNHEQEPVARFICPITMKEMNGKHRFVYLDSCGCVMSEQAMKEVPSKTCIKCTKTFESGNVIILNPKPEELEAMEEVLIEKQLKALAEKKEKKKNKANKKEQLEKINGADSTLLDSSSVSKRKLDEATTTTSDMSRSHKKQHLSVPAANSSSSTHSLTAAVAAKVAEQLAANAARPKSSAVQSLYRNGGRASRENFMNR